MGIAVNKKLLVDLNAIGAQQLAATEERASAIEQLLDYVSTYPDDDILFRNSDTILAAHTDAGFLNKPISRSRAGAYIFLSENEPKPKLNVPVLTILQTIKTVMESAAEAITEKNMI